MRLREQNFKWIGIDYGMTLMDPRNFHHSEIISRIYKILNCPEVIEEKIRKWKELRESVANSPSLSLQEKVRLLKEYHRDKIYSEIFDNNMEAIRLYEKFEVEELRLSPGVKDFLKKVSSKVSEIAIVSEATNKHAALQICRFVKYHGLESFINAVITPAGLYNTKGLLVDDRFIGATKVSGELYDKLKERLREMGIKTSEAIIIGDDPIRDIRNARERGFFTILYIGVVNRGNNEEADMIIEDWDSVSHLLLKG